MAQNDVAARRFGAVYALVVLQDVLGTIVDAAAIIVNLAVAAL